MGEAQRILDAKPRTSLRSYWHTLPKKKRADPIEDESEVQQGHFCPPPFSRSRTWTLPLIAPSQQAVSLPLQGMEVWMNRHQIEEFGFSFQQYHDKSIPDRKSVV